MGWSKASRDYLGRWGIDGHQSHEYVLTSRQIILEIQCGVTEALCVGGKSFDECEMSELWKTRAI